MKKIFAILTVTSFLTACNNSSKETTKTDASDSLDATESPLMDAENIADSANKILHDSTHHMIDTSGKK